MFYLANFIAILTNDTFGFCWEIFEQVLFIWSESLKIPYFRVSCLVTTTSNAYVPGKRLSIMKRGYMYIVPHRALAVALFQVYVVRSMATVYFYLSKALEL